MTQHDKGDLELFSVYVPTNHVYVGDIFLLGKADIIKTNLSVREGLGKPCHDLPSACYMPGHVPDCRITGCLLLQKLWCLWGWGCRGRSKPCVFLETSLCWRHTHRSSNPELLSRWVQTAVPADLSCFRVQKHITCCC